MKKLAYIVLMIIACALSFHAHAQTPYDSFAPDCTRPMLGLDALQSMKEESISDTKSGIVALDTQQQRILLVKAEDGKIIAYTSLADNIHKWMSVDPLADKYPGISPYAYCHWNPIGLIDPNGMDDLFNELGNYIEHIDNGTDFVIIQQANGEERNITEFSYCEEDVANRAMLANVATYYAQLIGLNQTLDICDVEREDAMALTDIDSDFHQVYIAVLNGMISSYANTGSNIMNALEHEREHVEKGISGSMAEVYAVQRQLVHSTWVNTTDAFKQGVVSYLINQSTNAIQNGHYNEVKSLITPNLGIINQIRNMRFVGNLFIYTRDPYYNMPDIECRPK